LYSKDTSQAYAETLFIFRKYQSFCSDHVAFSEPRFTMRMTVEMPMTETSAQRKHYCVLSCITSMESCSEINWLFI